MKLLIFAGTYEGRRLCETCSRLGIPAHVCVATEYGEAAIGSISGITVLQGRLTCEEMEELIFRGGYDLIIDATHPYATLVSHNIKLAAQTKNKEYIRLIREDIKLDSKNIIEVSSIKEAVEIINKTSENVLVTTGSKELSQYNNVIDLDKRLFARVLPTEDSLSACIALGLPNRNIICMQGPFTKEMNFATLKQFNCGYMVTKSTGAPGGFEEKVLSAAEIGIKVIVICRPTDETGYSLDSVCRLLEDRYGK